MSAMMRIEVTNRDGTIQTVTADAGGSVMEALKHGGITDILALCGGCASCGTCHVQIDPAWFGRLPPMDEEEEEMLSLAAHRSPYSRLSCQIAVRPELDGLRLAVAPDG